MYNEILVRQMYEGRKWFVERYPEVDSARVAFQQDCPAKALQTAQIYNRSGIAYFKASRLGDVIFRWAAPDGSSVLAFEQVDYGELNSPLSAESVYNSMVTWQDQFQDASAPPWLPLAAGSDYHMPWSAAAFQAEWENVSGPAAFGGPAPPLQYSHAHEYLKRLSAFPGFNPRVLRGERPNLWFAETTWTHHKMFDDQRVAGRNLPAAEAFSTFRALAQGSWVGYPSDELATAWLNVTLGDHGIGPEHTPFNMPCRGPMEANTSHPWTPFLCNLVRPISPAHADEIYALRCVMSLSEQRPLRTNRSFTVLLCQPMATGLPAFPTLPCMTGTKALGKLLMGC